METEFQYMHVSDFHQFIPTNVIVAKIQISKGYKSGQGV